MLGDTVKENKVAYGIKLANQLILRCGGEPGLSRWAKLITRVRISGRGRQESETQRNGSRRRTWPRVPGFEDGGVGTQIKESGWPLEAGKGQETSPPRVFRRNRPEDTELGL